MITEIRFKKGLGVPASLKLAEPAVDTLNKIVYIGLTDGENGGSDFMKIIDEEAVKNIVAETTLNSDLIILGNDQFVTSFVIQRSFATKDLVYIYVYTYYCVTEIFRTESSTTRLRFAQDDTVEKVDVPEILRFALDDNRD